MKLKRFNDLAIAEKAWLLKEYGQYLLALQHYGYTVLLYALNQHFIEIFLDPQTRRVEKISAATYKQLDKYLSQIPISRLNR
ncbi:MAG TPA: hypothetical protein VEB86_12995 [Chryseosolibacter sp.]|nr:hypothetical protein [Chryseosolibacter sp.]